MDSYGAIMSLERVAMYFTFIRRLRVVTRGKLLKTFWQWLEEKRSRLLRWLKASSFIASPREQFHPELDIPSVSELAMIAEIRGIGGKALELAVTRGFLFTSTLKQERAWIITDASRRCYLARRLNGQLWEHIDGKAYTLYGSQANWPIGIEEAAGYGAIAMVEGAPDFLSALHLGQAFTVVELLVPVCMSASSVRIPEDALPLFRDKRVRIFVHSDEAGESAAGKWANQLRGITAKTDGYLFIPPVKDLNELIRSSDEYKQRHRSELAQIMNFVRPK
jgi:Toprim-like